MKRIALWTAFVGLSLAATQAASQTIEDQLKNLKRLRDSGLISEPVYVEQQRRILEAPPITKSAPAGPAAAGAASTEAPAAASASMPGMPAVGTIWNYRLQDRLFRTRQHAFAIKVSGMNGPLVNELVQAEQGGAVTTPVDSQAVRFLERDVGDGQKLIELSPYLLNAAKGNMLPNPPTHYPLGTSREPFRVRVSNIVEDQISVPAGSFKAIRVDVTGERGASGFAGLSGHDSLGVTRFRYTTWYSREMNRYVMVRHQQWNTIGTPVTDEVVQLVSHSAR